MTAGTPVAASDAAVLGESLLRPERFAVIYGRYFAEIYRYVAGRLGRDAADDLAAEAFLTAFRRRTSFDPVLGSVRPWLYGIATNLVAQRRDEIRRYRALGKCGPGDADDGDQRERIAPTGLLPPDCGSRSSGRWPNFRPETAMCCCSSRLVTSAMTRSPPPCRSSRGLWAPG